MTLPSPSVVDHPKTAALSAASHSPSQLAHFTGSLNDITCIWIFDQSGLEPRILVIGQKLTNKPGEELRFDETVNWLIIRHCRSHCCRFRIRFYRLEG